MAFWEAVRLALQTIRAQKLKSAFSIIGVFIGVMFLIAVVSVVQGMNRYMTDKFAGTLLGVNTFRLRQFPDVQLGNVTDSMWRVWRRRPRVSYDDAQAVMRGVTVPVLAAWESSTRTTLVAGHRHAKDVEVTAATELYFDIRSLAVERGRPFTGQEVQAGVPVLVLGYELAEKLFEGQDPLGREVKIFDLPYRVIGVVEKQGNLFGLSLDKFAVAPASAPVKRYVSEPRMVDAVAMKARTQSDMREALGQAEAILRNRRHLRRRRGRRGRVPGEPRRATRSDRRPAARDMTGGALFEGVGIALDSLRSNKRRAALTILGVAIGVTVVMVIAAMISGINRSVSSVIESIAPRTFLVWRFFQAGVNVSDGSDESSPWRRNPEIVELEADRIAVLPSVRYVTRRDESSATVEYGDRRLESVNVSGLSAQWVEGSGGDVHPGRTFTRLEDLANDAVAVINTKLEEQLFRGRDPIGQTIHVAGASFKVIGVYVPPPNLFSGATPPFVGIPHGAFVKHVPYVRGLMRLAVAPGPAYTQQQAMDEVVATLRSLRGLKPGQENNFSIVTQDKLLDSWNKVSGMFFLVMLVLSSIALMVGGVGVVAIMMISVTERTREIGVRKALGATSRAIRWQFLVEASTLTLVGGAIGMLVGGLLAFVISRVTPIPANVPLWSIVAALAASALTAAGFGLYPASTAARTPRRFRCSRAGPRRWRACSRHIARAGMSSSLGYGGRSWSGRTPHRLRASRSPRSISRRADTLPCSAMMSPRSCSAMCTPT